MACYQQKNCKHIKAFVKIVVIFIVVLIAIFSYFHFYVNPQIVASNTAKIKAFSVGVINSAVTDTISGNDYDNLIKITKNEEGNITLIEVNSKNVNILSNNIMTHIQNKLDEKDLLSFNLPVGAFTGIPILSSFGPKVKLNIVPIGNVRTEYNSQIASLSINQSYHKIYIQIKVSVCVVLPLYTQNIDISSQILVAENILVGKIPNTYLNTDNLTNALNLIP